MAKTVSALKMRRNLGELLNDTYYRGEEIVIERKGRPIAKLIRLETFPTTKKDPFISAAGAWKDLDAERIKTLIKKSRADRSSKKKLLANW